MAEIVFENGHISNFEGLVTLTLNRVILHTVVHHSSTSTYMPNFIEIEESFCGRTYVRRYVRTDEQLRPALFEGSLRRVDLKMIQSFSRDATHGSDGRTDGRTDTGP